jgi:hypothetical protein
MINDVGDEPTPVKASGKISPKEVYERLVEPLGKPQVYEAQAPTLPPAPIPGLTPGRMVHYVLSQDEHRPGIITSVVDAVDGTVNLVVFYDGAEDGRSESACAEWTPFVQYSEFGINDSWHFIEKA